ncbi:MAG TPA: D-glycerate dehydrogenase [Gemmataceae bacterium]|nr:D-glycerate dehydrogenase [Gemmataceae bacterium]
MPAKPRVFVSRRIPAVGLDLIEPHCDADVWGDPLPPPVAVLRDRVSDCEGLISLLTDRVDAELLDAAPKLKVVSNFAVGFNNIDLAAATKRGVRVGNTPGVLTEATADIAITLLLAAARRLGESTQDARDGRWKTWDPLGWLGQDLVGCTLGIVGMGRIGYSVARKLHFGWGMKVLYTDQVERADVERELKASRVDFDTLLRESDFVSVHTDLNPQTKGLFGASQFAKMKPTAVFINTARGPIVDQRALAAALRSITIFAAGLDVTDPEPLPPDHELLHLPNCVVAPHIASATVHTRNEMARICAENLIAGLSGKSMTSCVNPEAMPAAAR